MQMPIRFRGPRMARHQVDEFVNAQALPESPVVGTIQVAPQAGGHFRSRPVIAWRTIGAEPWRPIGAKIRPILRDEFHPSAVHISQS